MSLIRPILLIAGNTITGILRGVVLNVLLVLAGLLIIAGTASFSLEELGKYNVLVDSGLAIITVLGAMIAILTGFTIIPREVETRTIYPIMSKPIYRWQYVLGKFLGAAGVDAITVGLLSVIFFLIYFVRLRVFDVRLLVAVLMILAMLVVLSGLIIFLSTFMSWIGTIIVSAVVWFLGNYSTFLYDLSTQHEQNPMSSTLVAVVHKIIPNFQQMDMRFVIVQQDVGFGEPSVFLIPLAYGLLFTAIVLALATLIFNYREM
jgi:ABC-type transport system involved in multi-copper enzyme maturation permease subunit